MRKEALPWIGLVALMLALQWLGLAEALEYRRTLNGPEPWRWLGGHLVHLSWRHALVNCIALMLLERLAAPWLSPAARWLALAGGMIAVSLALTLFLPALEWYRGLSGALHGLFFAAAVAGLRSAAPGRRWLPIGLIAGGLLKVLLEQPGSAAEFPLSAWLGEPVVPQAHLAGAIAGLVLGLILHSRPKLP